MKFRNLIFLLASLSLNSCKEKENPIDKIISEANQQEDSLLFVHNINPGDCMTCIAVGKFYYKILRDSIKPANKIVFVIPEIRKADSIDLFTNRLPDDYPRENILVIKNTALNSELQNLLPRKNFFSFLLVINQKTGKVTFAENFKSRTFFEKLGERFGLSIDF